MNEPIESIKQFMKSLYPYIKRDDDDNPILDKNGNAQLDEEWLNNNNPQKETKNERL